MGFLWTSAGLPDFRITTWAHLSLVQGWGGGWGGCVTASEHGLASQENDPNPGEAKGPASFSSLTKSPNAVNFSTCESQEE